MTVFSPSQKQICEYKCDTEGRDISCERRCNIQSGKGNGEKSNHRFLILSQTGYNQISKYILGFPITSKTNYLISEYLKFTWTIDPDLISNNKPPFTKDTMDKETKILCDRPCRISKECICPTGPDSFGQLSDKGYAIVINKFLSFCGGNNIN